MRTEPAGVFSAPALPPQAWQVGRCCRLQHPLMAILALALASVTAWGQAAASGTVGGQVTDQGGATVAGAAVQLIDVDTKTARSTASNATGRYDLVNVPPGVYDLTVGHPGFALARVPAQKVDVGLSLTLDVRLEVGTTSTTVDVTASAGAELQTLNATVGATIAGDSLMLLPNLNRDVSSLSVLQVGVTPSGQVAGVQSDQNAFQVDGGSISDDMAGTSNTYTTSFASNNAPSGVVPTPIESVEEFKVNLSNRDLATMVESREFRSDLYYRLNVFPIRVPALRERPEDIPLLVRHFAQQFSRRIGKHVDSISARAMNALVRYSWPGNIRELQNVIERAVILSTGPVLEVSIDDLRPAAGSSPMAPESDRDMRSVLNETERQQMLGALEKANWRVAGPNGAAALLGMKRSTLQSRMQKLGIRNPHEARAVARSAPSS